MTQISVHQDVHNINKIYTIFTHSQRKKLQIRIQSLYKQTIYTIVLTNECNIYDVRAISKFHNSTCSVWFSLSFSLLLRPWALLATMKASSLDFRRRRHRASSSSAGRILSAVRCICIPIPLCPPTCCCRAT